MKVLVINLRRSHQRRDRMIEQLNRLQLDWELVEAVDGQSLTDQEITTHCAAMSTEMRRDYLTPGAIGCALSHLKALQLTVMRGYERVCILEDDLLLPEDFPTILQEVMAQARDREVVLLYWLSFVKQLFDRQTASQLTTGHYLVESRNAHQLLSTVGYIVSRGDAQTIIESNQPVRVTADSWGYFLSIGAVDRIRCLVPSPIQMAPVPSEILLRSGHISSRLKYSLESILPPLRWLAHRRRNRFYTQQSKFDWV